MINLRKYTPAPRALLAALLLLAGCSAVPEESKNRYPAPTNAALETPLPTPTPTPMPTSASPEPSPTPSTPPPVRPPVPAAVAPPPPLVENSPSTQQAMASCAAEIGYGDAAYLARQCSVVSGAPCSADQSCRSLRHAIDEGCRNAESPPGFCQRR